MPSLHQSKTRYAKRIEKQEKEEEAEGEEKNMLRIKKNRVQPVVYGDFYPISPVATGITKRKRRKTRRRRKSTKKRKPRKKKSVKKRKETSKKKKVRRKRKSKRRS